MQTAYRCLNVRELVKKVKKDKDGSLPTPSSLLTVIVCDRKPE